MWDLRERNMLYGDFCGQSCKMKFTKKTHLMNLISFLLGQQPLYCTSSSELDLGSHNENKGSSLLWRDFFFQIRGKADNQVRCVLPEVSQGEWELREHLESSPRAMLAELNRSKPNQREVGRAGRLWRRNGLSRGMEA